MSDPVTVTRAMLVALREEIGDDDPCGRAIIETALEFGDALHDIASRPASDAMAAYAKNALHGYGWEVAP